MKPLNSDKNIVKSQIEQNFENWYNNKQATSTIGDLINHEAFSTEGYLDDVIDVEVRHSIDEGSLAGTDLAQDNILAGRTCLENNKPVIYTNTNLPKNIVEENIYHEIGHVRQFQEALEGLAKGDTTLYNQLKEYIQALQQNLLSEEDYLNHPLEVAANNTKEFLKGTKEQYEQTIQLRKTRDNSRGNRPTEQRDGDTLSNPYTSVNTGTRGNGSRASQEGSVQGSNEQTEPIQLQLDFTTADEATSKLVSGEIKPKTLGDVETIATKFADDVEITGHNWKAYAQDADKIPTDVKELLELNDIKLQFDESGDKLRAISRKELAITKIISQINEKLYNSNKNMSDDDISKLQNILEYCKDYVQSIKSAKGEGLNEEKIVNKALESFGSKRLSSLTKEGISNFVDLAEKVQAIYAKLSELDPELMHILLKDKNFGKYVDDLKQYNLRPIKIALKQN